MKKLFKTLILLFIALTLSSEIGAQEENIDLKFPSISYHDFYVNKHRLLYSVSGALDFNDDRLLNLEAVLDEYSSAQRKIFLWSKFVDFEYCECFKKECFVEKFLLPFEDELISFYEEIGYPEKDLKSIRRYFKQINLGEQPYRIRNSIKAEVKNEMVNNFILKNIDSLVVNPNGETFDNEYTGWLEENFGKHDHGYWREGTYKMRLENGELFELQTYSKSKVLLHSAIYKPEYKRYIYYSTGELRFESYYVKSEADEKENITKQYYKTGELFSEGPTMPAFNIDNSTYHIIGDKKIQIYHKNGQLAYKKTKYQLFGDSWDEEGNPTVIDGTGTYLKWELVDGEMALVESVSLRNGLKHGPKEIFHKGRLFKRTDYLNGKRTRNVSFLNKGEVKYITEFENGKGSKSRYEPPLEEFPIYLHFRLRTYLDNVFSSENDLIYRKLPYPKLKDTLIQITLDPSELKELPISFYHEEIMSHGDIDFGLTYSNKFELIKSDIDFDKDLECCLTEKEFNNYLQQLEFFDFPTIEEKEVIKLRLEATIRFGARER